MMYQKLINFDKTWLVSWNNFASRSDFWKTVFKVGSEYFIYLIPVILLILWFWDFKNKNNKIAGLQALVSAGLAALAANIIGRLINRPRPFELPNIHELIFHRPDYSFPSDHASVLFAVTFSLFLSGYKKLGYFFLVVSLIMSVSRISMGIHYPSDILAGAVLGLLAAWVIWLLERPLTYVYNLIILLAKKIRLA